VTARQQEVADFEIDNLPPSEKENELNTRLTIELEAFIQLASQEKISTPGSKAVKKAGRALRKQEGDLKQARERVQAFRAGHEKPLDLVANIIERCSRAFSSAKPYKRLKRLDTIIDKLQRLSLDGLTANQTCISNMADIGGCRLIVADLDTLNKVYAVLEKNQHQRLSIRKTNDYINQPKTGDCGYRCLHLIYQYQDAQGKSFKIEVQLRTELQHIWATAVEIIDTLEQTKIKTHSHAPDITKPAKQVLWEELLAIMSRYIADKEGVSPLDSESKARDTKRLQQLNRELKAVDHLNSFRIMGQQALIPEDAKGNVLFVFQSGKTSEVQQYFFEERDRAVALVALNSLESTYGTQADRNVLLVSTKALSSLSTAYPNYIGDCQQFIKLLNDAMKAPS